MTISVCSHSASHALFIDSIRNQCPFVSYPCQNADAFYAGDCLRCGQNGCNRMGYWSSQNKDLNQLYLKTLSIENNKTCEQHFEVTLTSGQNNLSKAKGYFSIVFRTMNETSESVVMDNDATVFVPYAKNSFLVAFANRLDEEVLGASISYQRDFNILGYTDAWAFDKIEVFAADSQTVSSLCPVKTSGTQNTQDFVKC